MTNAILYGIGAGLLTTVMFASAMTGGILSIFLFMVTPLPIFLVGLGVSWLSAAFAAAIAGGVIAVLVNPLAGIVFAATQIAPVVVLCYLAQLGREVRDPQTGATTSEWYPIGRLVLWSAAMSCVLAILMLAIMGNDLDQLRAAIRKFIEEVLAQQLAGVTEGNKLKEEDLVAMTDITLRILPAVTTISIMSSHLLNLWLAGKMTQASGHLIRPWPELAALVYPAGTSLVLALAMMASLASGTVGLFGTAITGAFYLAYVLLGLAIIHYVTRGKSWRPFLLTAMYAALFINSGLTIIVAIIGLTESFSPLRRDFLRGPPGAGPPSNPPSAGNPPGT